MKTLCLYYTRTNTTKEAMETIARITDADLAEYTDGRDRSGVLGYIGACFVSVKRALPKVFIKGEPDLSAYDRVIIGMPVWAEGACAIGRALIRKYRDRLPGEVHYVVTHMGRNDYMKKIKAMDSLLDRPSSGQFSVRTKDNDYIKECTDYAETLVQKG
ncbi:MAG: hypothetical protein IJJ24_00810 [Solobacterium sp.]|nr:hypothetical protein [Solobacterium sp.]